MPNEYPTKYQKTRKLAKKGKPEKVLAKINTEKQKILSAETKSYEKGQSEEVDELKWKKGYIGGDIVKGDAISFLKVEKVIKPEPKAFQDARGYVIADYQEYLEKQWIEDLKKEYPIKINKDVLNSLVK
jgi:peptidyl-prolyl cis-trans isomerase SurA